MPPAASLAAPATGRAETAVRDNAVAAAVAAISVLYVFWTLQGPSTVSLEAINDLRPLPVQILVCLCVLVGGQKAKSAQDRRAWTVVATAYAAYVVGDAAWASAEVIRGVALSPFLADVSDDLIVLAIVAVLALRRPPPDGHERSVVQSVRSFVSTDSLTGLIDAKHFAAATKKEIDRAWSLGTDVSLLLVDVDLFTSITHVYGDNAGDEAVVGVAAAVGSAVGPHQLIGRHGRDEVAVLLAGDAMKATEVAGRIHQAVAVVRLDRAPGRPISVSIGQATVTGGDDFAALLARANRSLHDAKMESQAGVTYADGHGRSSVS